MKKWRAALAAASLVVLAGCSTEPGSAAPDLGPSIEVTAEGAGSSPEDPLPFGGAYLLPSGLELQVGAPKPETLSGTTAEQYHLGVGDPTGVTVTFVNRTSEDMTSGGVSIEMTSDGVPAQVILEGDAERVFRPGPPGTHAGEDLSFTPPLLLAPGKPYTFHLIFLPMDPNDMTLVLADEANTPVYLSTQ